MLLLAAISPAAGPEPTARPPLPPVFIVPNFHPASCGWLANWSVERSYCANSYLAHLARVESDPNYRFVLSEVNNQIAILNFRPERFEVLRQQVRAGRVELVNAFFLEPTINLSGGEALVRMGVEGLRWQQRMLGVRPRFCWAIDVCGTHEQMPQIVAGLGLEALVYTRGNRMGRALYWSEAPDGARVLTIAPGHYSELRDVFAAQGPLDQAALERVQSFLAGKLPITPPGAPVLVLGGQGDYALPPARADSPTAFLKEWNALRPDVPLQFTTLAHYLDTVRPLIDAGRIDLPTMRGGTAYDFHAFWIQNPRVKSWYRRDEHALQATEMLAAVASLKAGVAYPAHELNRAWLLMLLNMDRNTLWGAAGGMVFEDPESWDARDRFAWVETHSSAFAQTAARGLLDPGAAVGLFNPANWDRRDPVRLALPPGTSLDGVPCEQAIDGDDVFCRIRLPSVGIVGHALVKQAPARPQPIDLPPVIETPFYRARIDPKTGALVSLKTRPSDRELLGGPANEVVIERSPNSSNPGDHMRPRPERTELGRTSRFPVTVTTWAGPLAITVEARGALPGGASCRRLMRFERESPRIDCVTELTDLPDRTVTLAEFPLAETPSEVRRGIPFGFAHAAWDRPDPSRDGWMQGITPAVRWSDYSLPRGNGGLALLDRGVTGREIDRNIPALYLCNATDTYHGYPNAWLSGRGQHRLEYALLVRDGDWSSGHVARRAWEYNAPPCLTAGCAPASPRSFLRTSDNILVEALRRDGPDLEVRLVECLGHDGTAEVTVELPHTAAARTDLLGGRSVPLGGGPTYKIPVRPQQIVTLRLKTPEPVPDVPPLTSWDDLVPPSKRAALHHYRPEAIGHPPRGS
jgi:alpha-mannosidase